MNAKVVDPARQIHSSKEIIANAALILMLRCGRTTDFVDSRRAAESSGVVSRSDSIIFDGVCFVSPQTYQGQTAGVSDNNARSR